MGRKVTSVQAMQEIKQLQDLISLIPKSWENYHEVVFNANLSVGVLEQFTLNRIETDESRLTKELEIAKQVRRSLELKALARESK